MGKFNKNGKGGFKNVNAGSKGDCDEYKKSNQKGKKGSSGRYKSSDVGDRNGRASADGAGYFVATGHNDIAWYNKYPNMLSDAARVPFNKIAGEEYDVFPKCRLDNSFSNPTNYTVPGIVAMGYVPGIGITNSYSDAANRAFQSLWSAIYSKTSGFINFPTYTLANVYCAGQSIAQNIAVVLRALETSHLYDAKNHNFPRALLIAQGFDPDSIIGKQDKIRWAINDCIRDFNALCLPAYVDLFKRHYELAYNMFKDGPLSECQIYLFKPVMYYIFNDLGVYNNGEYDGNQRCDAYAMPYVIKGDADTPDYYTTVDIMDIVDIIKEQIVNIRKSDDFRFILGAIQRAFEDSQFIKIQEAEIDSLPSFVTSEEIMYQIHNANFAGMPSFDMVEQPNNFEGSKFHLIGGDIYGNPVTDLIKYNPVTSGAYTNAMGDKTLLNSFKDSVDTDWIVEATRLMCFVSDSPSSTLDGRPSQSNMYAIKILGSEYLTHLEVYKYNGTTGRVSKATFHGVVDADEGRTTLPAVLALSKFLFAPRCYLDVQGEIVEMFGDLHLWTTVDSDTLRGLHDTCLLSMLKTTDRIDVKHTMYR